MITPESLLPRFGRIQLTFDDGPDPTWTPRCLEHLARANAHATFFVIGTQAQRHPELLRRIVGEGHVVGNHTLTHAHPWRISERRARAEVTGGANALADILGFAPRYFRPPHGARRRCMTEEAHALDQTLVMWDVSAIDWGLLGTSKRIAKRLSRVHDGIVLMHDGVNKHNRPDQLLKALPEFLHSRTRN
jgi:peptidoglycan/xylan/chitin deacetylase (PgdA/CDA1 family)